MVDDPDPASRETLLMRGVLDMCVLALLEVESLHAYGLVQRLHAGGFTNASYGTIYPLVTRLRKQGLVDQQLEVSSAGPARNMLTINTRGRSALMVWVSQWRETTADTEAVLAHLHHPEEVQSHVV